MPKVMVLIGSLNLNNWINLNHGPFFEFTEQLEH